jgi:hypothetical protein
MTRTQVRIRFTSECLANAPTTKAAQTDPDRFERDADGRLLIDARCWDAAIKRAARVDPELGVQPGEVLIDPALAAPTVLWDRVYRLGAQTLSRTHETIPIATEAELTVIFTNRLGSGDRKRFMDTLGRFVGISPFGHHMGYGRFTVLGVREETRNTQTEST